MYTKRVLSLLLAVALVLSTVVIAFAEETIAVSLSAGETDVADTKSVEKDDSFNLYFGADKLELGGKKLNTYKFTVWYDSNYLKINDSAVSALSSAEGQAIHEKSTKKIDGTDYNGYTFTFASFEKGLGEGGKAFNALAKIPVKAVKTGTATVYLYAEDVSLLPVANADSFEDTLPTSVSGGKVTVTVKAKASDDDDGGSFFLGGGGTTIKRSVIFNVDGALTTVTLADGKKVTKPQDPVKEGYTFDGWYKEKTFENLYDFNIEVTESIVLYAKFVKNPEEPKLPFTDVNESDWFYQGIKYVWEQNMVKGVSETLYAPDNSLTRATLVTLLYRMENEPSAPANAFSDVASGAWYENAVAWAAEKEIVLGMGEGIFAPDVNITREQIAVILYKYTKFKGGDVSKTADLTAFSDVQSISDWAKDAMSWAVAEGLIQGMGEGTVAPGANATRAQIATILMRYMN